MKTVVTPESWPRGFAWRVRLPVCLLRTLTLTSAQPADEASASRNPGVRRQQSHLLLACPASLSSQRSLGGSQVGAPWPNAVA